MRALLFLPLLQACSYHEPSVGSDGNTPPPDVMDDSSTGGRIHRQLIGGWKFHEGSGLTAHDTSGAGTAVDLQANNAVTWNADGTMTISSPSPAVILSSGSAPHLNSDCQIAHAVTLEAWVVTGATPQGTTSAPVVVAGLCASVASRNISILQAGDQWLGRVRTNTTDPNWANGGPDLLSTQTLTTQMTHLVLVADATTRALYVNNQKVAETAPEGPLGWDGSYKMVLGNEIALYRPWLGTFALVAIYDRALSVDEIKANFDAGPTAPL